MGVLERLQRKNEDYLLLETIKRVGVQNYSLLARLTGLSAETIRYKVNKHLTKVGLNTTININYGELGLSVSYLILRPNSSSDRAWLNDIAYIIFNGKLIGTNRYFCLGAVPSRMKKKYTEILETLKAQGLLEDYEFKEMYWVRYPPFRAELYDFEERTWKIDWSRTEMFMTEIGDSFVAVNRDSPVDYIDLKILKAMLNEPTIPLAKAAKSIDANARTVRYHYTEHVMKNKFILSNNIRWVRPIQEGNPRELMQVVVLFRKLNPNAIEKVRKFCNNLPFTWFEAGAEDRTYVALMDVPMALFHESMRRIETALQGAGDNYEILLIDSSSTKAIGIPDEMFDKQRGWRLFGYSGAMPDRTSESTIERV